MAESLEQHFCSDCGIVISERKQECPECGKLLHTAARRRSKRLGLHCVQEGLEEPERSFDSRLHDGFAMLNWE
jgi:predicted RNA-binding Zn-ribbon protein involved in translation (DUF1610 family)